MDLRTVSTHRYTYEMFLVNVRLFRGCCTPGPFLWTILQSQIEFTLLIICLRKMYLLCELAL